MITTINSPVNIHVLPMTSPRSGRPVANQYVMLSGRTAFFQSYASLIAVYDRESCTLTLGRDWDYSVTTSKYLWQFLREYCYPTYKDLPNGKSGADSIRKAIESGLVVYDERMV